MFFLKKKVVVFVFTFLWCWLMSFILCFPIISYIVKTYIMLVEHLTP